MKRSAAARHSVYLCELQSSVNARLQLFDKESQFRSISSTISGRRGPLKVPVPYQLPNEEGYTWTTSLPSVVDRKGTDHPLRLGDPDVARLSSCGSG
mmetsp:Transcript_10615/g.16806  ORF Transcript_10615/g.16806 Transcript_10615/m.16806 type:complete len:97 (+) Transcript_10615:729-1019(+)